MNTKLKVVVVDDEQDAVSFICSLINDYCPSLEIVGTANNSKEGAEVITKFSPDLVFLDVEMPQGNGFDLLSRFPEKKFDVIFITAFNHYAIQAIKFSAVDYILKPINIREFIAAVEKVVSKINYSGIQSTNFQTLFENLKTNLPFKLAIPTAEGMEYIDTQSIVRIEADRSYSWFFLTSGRKMLISRNLKEYQDLLNDRNFFRPHNSHLINLEHVKKYIRLDGGAIEMVDGTQIPISRTRKDLFHVHMARFTGNKSIEG